MSEPTKYAEFVVPELGKSRLDAQWANIVERRSSGERKRLSATIPAVGIMVAACALAVVLWPHDARPGNESVWEGAVVASDDSPIEMTLAEGTHIQVEPRSEVKLLHSSSRAVQVRLGHGSARFQVSKKRTRRFSVNLGKVEVVVTGTQFRVVRQALPSNNKSGSAGDRVQVAVEEGTVEVHREDGQVISLHAGEDWSTVVSHDGVTPGDTSASAGSAGVSPDTRSTTTDAASLEPALPSDDSELPADGLAADNLAAENEESDLDGASELTADGVDVDGQDEVDEDQGSTRRRDAHRARRRRRAREAAADAGELLDNANLARRAGRLDDAAELYADLVRRFPKDRRASLAAFELGRLRMDSLRDVRGAVQALEKALKLDARGAFAEDALARLVLAEEARGDLGACNRARARYLARYPEGVHAQHVAERCGGN
jgi:TolA-binding protein